MGERSGERNSGGRLSARKIETLGPGIYEDGDGLRYVARSRGRGSRVRGCRLHGGRREMGLGRWSAVSLAEARERAREARRTIAQGCDPLEERRARAAAAVERVPTFAELAERVIREKVPGWRSTKHAEQWRSTLAAYAFPILGTLPVDRVETEHVLEVLRPLWSRVPETASRLRQRIESVLAAAAALGHRDRNRINPAQWKGHLQSVLSPPRRTRPVVHYPALPWRAAPAFYAALCARPSVPAPRAFSARFSFASFSESCASCLRSRSILTRSVAGSGGNPGAKRCLRRLTKSASRSLSHS